MRVLRHYDISPAQLERDAERMAARQRVVDDVRESMARSIRPWWGCGCAACRCACMSAWTPSWSIHSHMGGDSITDCTESGFIAHTVYFGAMCCWVSSWSLPIRRWPVRRKSQGFSLRREPCERLALHRGATALRSAGQHDRRLQQPD